MDIRLLRYFTVLADELHFGRAAVRLHMSQPPLSQQIRLLEAELGTPLFLRTQRRVELTAAGSMLKEQLPLVFSQLEKALDLTRQAGRGHMGKLEIGVISSVMFGIVPRLLRVFHERYPNVSWNLNELTPAEQMEALREKRLDVCFFRTDQNNMSHLVSEALSREAISVVLASGHRLAGREKIRLADLADESFVFFGLDRSQFAAYLRQCCIEAGFIPNIRQQVVEVQTLLSLVKEGFGVALLPASTGLGGHDGVVYRALTRPAPTTVLYVTYRKEEPSPALQTFLETARELSALELVK